MFKIVCMCSCSTCVVYSFCYYYIVIIFILGSMYRLFRETFSPSYLSCNASHNVCGLMRTRCVSFPTSTKVRLLESNISCLDTFVHIHMFIILLCVLSIIISILVNFLVIIWYRRCRVLEEVWQSEDTERLQTVV